MVHMKGIDGPVENLFGIFSEIYVGGRYFKKTSFFQAKLDFVCTKNAISRAILDFRSSTLVQMKGINILFEDFQSILTVTYVGGIYLKKISFLDENSAIFEKSRRISGNIGFLMLYHGSNEKY